MHINGGHEQVVLHLHNLPNAPKDGNKARKDGNKAKSRNSRRC